MNLELKGFGVNSDKIDYKIYGDDMQFVEIELDRGETVIAEAGAMMYMEDGINYETRMGDGSQPNEGLMSKIFSAGKRILTQESIFMTHFTSNKSGKKHVSFASPYPGKIIHIDLEKVRGEIICQKDAFLCAALGTKISVAFAKRLGAGLFGREGFILQKLQGNGHAFIHACGGIILKKLQHEKLIIDTGCIVAFTKGIDYDIQLAKGMKSMFFGGEGLFHATLSGTGYVWLQSLPFSRLADRVVSSYPSGGGKSRGETPALAGFRSVIDMLE